MEALKAAVAGCGRMGAFTSDAVKKYAPSFWFPLSHIEALKKHSCISEIAISDLRYENLIRAGKTYEINKIYSSAKQMLIDFQPDIFSIATRTNSKTELIIHGLDAGVRAFHIEKPLCNSIKELEKLDAALDGSDVYVTYGAIRRFFPIYQEAIKVAKNGKFGKLKEINIGFGTGMLFWTHPHSIDLILYAADSEVEGVQAKLGSIEFGASRVDVINDPVVLAAEIYFSNGVLGRITQSLGADLIITCEHGQIYVCADGKFVNLYAVPSGETYPIMQELKLDIAEISYGGTYLPIDELVGCLQNKSECLTSNLKNKKDILLGQKILFSMVQSHLENSKIIPLYAIDMEMKVAAITNGNYA